MTSPSITVIEKAAKLFNPALIKKHQHQLDLQDPQNTGEVVKIGTEKFSEVKNDWQFASFSLVFPLSNAATSTNTSEFVDLNWDSGRFKGVTQLIDESREYKNFYQKSAARFPGNFGDAVGAQEADRVGGNEPEEKLESEKNSRFRFNHIVLEPILGITEFQLNTQWPPPSSGTDDYSGTLRIVGMEYLQYKDFGGHDCEDEYRNQFLVLHIVATNCTSATLTKISEALYRPRNGLRFTEDTVAAITTQVLGRFKGNYGTFKVLPYFSALALEMLNAFSIEDSEVRKTFCFTLEKGGYIQGNCFKETFKELGIRTSPFRIVSAIPNEGLHEYPSIFEAGTSENLDYANGWAWALASGIDKFGEHIPSLTENGFAQFRPTDYRLWDVLVQSNGMAFVRKPKFHQGQDNRAWLLAQTRYVDLVVISLRAQQALAKLSMKMQSTADSGSLAEDKPSASKLSEDLDQLEIIQKLALSFRRHLWFEAVESNTEDTKLLRAINLSNGNQQLYADFLDEMNMRKDIYETIYRRSNEVSRRSNEEASRVEDARDRARNLLLSIMAVAFAIPAWFEVFGLTFGIGTGSKALVFSVLLVAILAVVLKAHTFAHNRKN